MSDKIPNRYNWNFGVKGEILKDKDRIRDLFMSLMLIRTQRMFEYKNLPSTIPQRELELITQVMRFCIFKKVDGELYVFYGGLGGIPNEYYQPTTAIINNPYLRYNEICEIGEDCVVMWNDSMHMGLMGINDLFASHLAEVNSSLRFANVNARINALIRADDDSTKTSAEKVLEDIENGVKLGVIVTSAFTENDGIATLEFQRSASSNTIKDLIEEWQYIQATWFHVLGLNSNYNMKREAINESESSLDDDVLLPLVDDMLYQRKQAIEKVNEMFGTNIEVELSSAWKKQRKEIEIEEKIQEKELTPVDTPKTQESEEEVKNDETKED